jgi:UDP-N-acetylmuramate dehydrogenase
MLDRSDVPLARYTTLGLGGPARRLLTCVDETEVVAAVRAADAAREPLLVLGGGSNVVLPDAGWPGTVVRIASRGVEFGAGEAGAGRVLVRAQAGEDWDSLVALTVTEGLAGFECLSGIPGLAGGTPVQNVGAYGADTSQTVTSVRVLDRADGSVADLPAADCAFAYRSSRFKHTDRYVVLRVDYALAESSTSAPVRYAELARALGVPLGADAPVAAVRAQVLRLRRGKGMVYDAADPDSHSVGSFFLNPVVDAAVAAGLGDAPSWPEPDGRVKLSAAWLIEHAGFGKGFGDGPERLSSKHTLALTHRGGGSAAGLLRLAATVTAGVRERFGVELQPEPRIVAPPVG